MLWEDLVVVNVITRFQSLAHWVVLYVLYVEYYCSITVVLIVVCGARACMNASFPYRMFEWSEA